MFCRSCGSFMEDEHMVCSQCGTRKGDGNSFCSECGAAVVPGTAFCQNCGVSFTAAPAAEPFVQPQANTAAPKPEKKTAKTVKYFCRNCGTEIPDGSKTCTACGTKKGEGAGFCQHCGASVEAGAENCASCGKSVLPPFDFGKYFGEFASNFTGIFKNPGFPGLIFDYGTVFTSVLAVIFAFLPCYFYLFLGNLRTLNLFQHTWLAGLLVVLAMLFSVRRFMPHVFKFISSDPTLEKISVCVVPGLHLLALIVVLVQTIIDLISRALFIWPFVFGGLFILLTLAEIVIAIVAILRKAGKLKF